MPRNRFIEWLGRSMLRAGGWHMVGQFPGVPKAVVIAAPHSSNWDGIWGIAAKAAMGVKLSILGKDALLRIPLIGAVLRWQGVIPVDRSTPRGLVEQAIEAIHGADRMWYAIAPEGTRKWVDHWKPGFWRIAHGAGVPVIPAYFDYASKTIGVGEPILLTDDMQADIARVQRWYRPYKGRNHDALQPDPEVT